MQRLALIVFKESLFSFYYGLIKFCCVNRREKTHCEVAMPLEEKIKSLLEQASLLIEKYHRLILGGADLLVQ